MGKISNSSIGVFGGSFDPPHKGHIKICSFIIKKLKLRKLHWIVTKKNPFKKKTFFTLNERIKKCKEISKNKKKIKVQFLEKLTKSSRTIDILKYISIKNKNSDIYLIVGSDNLIHFHKWKSWKKILKICKLVVFSRKNYEKKAAQSVFMKYLNKEQFIYIKNCKIDISSSQLRKIYLK